MIKSLSKISFYYQDYIPKSFVCLREGYSFSSFLSDLYAGVTVGIVALPLALAFAIGSGVPPEKGLFTAIVAGFLISLLGGSRVQIGGPTGTFVIIVYSIVQRHGYEGLAISMVIGGILMILMGISRCGVLLKFIPYPVTIGFTTGIALTIFSSQIKDACGLQMDKVPVDFFGKWICYFANASTWNPWALMMATATLALIFILRSFYPRLPGVFLTISLMTFLAQLFHLPLDTIENKFGSLPQSLPWPSLPSMTFEKIQEVFPDGITLALLGAIESLLSAMVADGLIGHRHRSNCELVAQGFANIGSVIFGGIPATGAIARTTMNIKMGAKTPLAGMIHALTLFFLMFFLAPFTAKIPLCILAAVLIFIAWNISELEHFIAILRSQISDALVLLITFSLTVLINLTVAVQAGVVLAAILFLKRMIDSTTIEACRILIQEEDKQKQEVHDADILFRQDVPSDVTVFEIKGPFFFGVADLLNETLRRLTEKPYVFILRMHKVPIIDMTGLQALKKFAHRCQEQGIILMISGAHNNLLHLFKKTGLESVIDKSHFFPHINAALEATRKLKYKAELPLPLEENSSVSLTLIKASPAISQIAKI